MWKNTDPRFEISKRATIIVVRPSINGLRADVASVDVKNNWSVFFDESFLDVDDSWDDAWWWALAP